MPLEPLYDESWWDPSKSPMSIGAKTVGLVLFAAACLTSLGAWLGYDYACVNYEGAERCLGRETEWAWHLALALAGLVAAGVMLYSAFRGPRRAFVTFLVAGLVLYAASILLADAGTHGWSNLKLFPSID